MCGQNKSAIPSMNILWFNNKSDVLFENGLNSVSYVGWLCYKCGNLSF